MSPGCISGVIVSGDNVVLSSGSLIDCPSPQYMQYETKSTPTAPLASAAQRRSHVSLKSIMYIHWFANSRCPRINHAKLDQKAHLFNKTSKNCLKINKCQTIQRYHKELVSCWIFAVWMGKCGIQAKESQRSPVSLIVHEISIRSWQEFLASYQVLRSCCDTLYLPHALDSVVWRPCFDSIQCQIELRIDWTCSNPVRFFLLIIEMVLQPFCLTDNRRISENTTRDVTTLSE